MELESSDGEKWIPAHHPSSLNFSKKKGYEIFADFEKKNIEWRRKWRERKDEKVRKGWGQRFLCVLEITTRGWRCWSESSAFSDLLWGFAELQRYEGTHLKFSSQFFGVSNNAVDITTLFYHWISYLKFKSLKFLVTPSPNFSESKL